MSPRQAATRPPTQSPCVPRTQQTGQIPKEWLWRCKVWNTTFQLRPLKSLRLQWLWHSDTAHSSHVNLLGDPKKTRYAPHFARDNDHTVLTGRSGTHRPSGCERLLHHRGTTGSGHNTLTQSGLPRGSYPTLQRKAPGKSTLAESPTTWLRTPNFHSSNRS